MHSDRTSNLFPRLARDLEAICNTGGRLTGTESERRATSLLKVLGSEVTGVPAKTHSFYYGAWRGLSSDLQLPDGSVHACHPLVRTVPTPPGGLRAEVIDLGRGTKADFDANSDRIAGRIVLVRHELMFAAGTVHRRFKYGWALEMGAVGFLIASPVPDTPVTGSSGRADGDGIPAAGISAELAALLTERSETFVTLKIKTQESSEVAENLLFDMPGSVDEWIVLSAHIDGHDLAESAMDNATGLAVALSVADRVRQMRGRGRGVRLAFFNAEEWALTGSRQYVAELPPQEREALVLNVNVDTVGCGKTLTALTSDFPRLEPLLSAASRASNVPLAMHRPLQRNSDHANFAEAGIPAFRLVSGFDDPDAPTRLLLTRFDLRRHVDLARLQEAASLTFEIVQRAASAAEKVKWHQPAPIQQSGGG